MTELSLSFDEVNDALQRAGVEQDVAELHGVLTGMLCTCSGIGEKPWLDELFSHSEPGDALARQGRDYLAALFQETQAQLHSEQFDFQPFLPADSAGLVARVEALAAWCQGFLFGLSKAGMTNTDALPGDLPEIVRDFLEISRAESYDLEDSEQAETDYAELVEYLRVSTQLFLEEMQQLTQAAQQGQQPLH